MRKIELEGRIPAATKQSINQTPARSNAPRVTTDRISTPDKQPTKPRRFNWRRILAVLVVVLLIGGGIFVYSRWQRQLSNNFSASGERVADACVNILDPQCWTQAFKPQLDKVDGKTNALLVGIDTRETGSGAGLANTDTIILATLNHETGQTRMISFPRDLYAPYQYTDDGPTYKTKINAIYAAGNRYAPDKNGMTVLKRTIEKITGEKIQYTGLIRIEGVVKAIDALGGVDVNVQPRFDKASYTDVYPYIELPSELQKTCKRSKSEPAYCEFTFQAGVQHMDGQMALIYARMRKYTDDFDRGRRQQHVIDAVKEKVVGDETPIAEKAENLLTIYTNISKYVTVDINLEMILAGLDLIDKVDRDPISIVLDPSFGGGGLIVAGEGSNYNFKDYTFKQVQDKLAFISRNAGLYRDAPKILAVNLTGEKWANDNPIIKLKDGGYWFTEIVTETKPKSTDKTGIEIIDYTGGSKDHTTAYLKEQLMAFYELNESSVTIVVANAENGLKASTKYKEDIQVNIYPKPLTAQPESE